MNLICPSFVPEPRDFQLNNNQRRVTVIKKQPFHREERREAVGGRWISSSHHHQPPGKNPHPEGSGDGRPIRSSRGRAEAGGGGGYRGWVGEESSK